MPWTLDARVPVHAVPDLAALQEALAAGPAAALLVALPAPDDLPGAAARADYAPASPHVGACSCCGGRPPAATALDRLFQGRLRGTSPWFDRVIALVTQEAACAALHDALTADAVTQARFRAG